MVHPDTQSDFTTRMLGLGGPAGPAAPAGPSGPGGPAGPAGPALPCGPCGPAGPASPCEPLPHPARAPDRAMSNAIVTAKCAVRIFRVSQVREKKAAPGPRHYKIKLGRLAQG